MIRNQNIKGTFICEPLFFKWMGVFQSWLDCFSIGVLAFIHYSKYKLFHLQQSLYAGVHFLQYLNVLTYSHITLFFKSIKLHQIFSLFSTINLAYVLEINVFGRDYSNLNNLFLIYSSPVHTQVLLQRTGTKSDTTKQGLFWHYIL